MLNKSQFFFVAAISLAGVLSTTAAEEEEGSSTPDGMTVEFDEMSISAENGRQSVRGNVVVSVGKLDLRTHELVYDSQTQMAAIPGAAAINIEGLRFVITNAEYDGVNQNVVARDTRGGLSPMFLQGGTITASSSNVHIEDADIFFGEPHWSAVSISAGSLDYFSKEDNFHVEDMTIRIAGLPVMYLPALTAPRFDKPPLRVQLKAGRESPAGEFFQTTTFLTVWDALEPGMLFDFYTSSGLLVGPALAYNIKDENFCNGFSMHGEVQTGYINDTANREDDIYGESTTGPRRFINWFHKQETAGAEISASIHYWSDANVMRNFREDIYDENQNPESYVEFVIPDSRFYISAITRMYINDFQNTQQRLPEIRVDFMPTEIAETKIYQRGFASYALLREEDSGQYTIRQRNDDDELTSSRVDFYYGLDCPIEFGDIATFRPVVGVRMTHYGETVPEDESSYTRFLGQVGFDLHFLATGTFDYDNETWGINGLKHVFRPVFQYRYFPGSRSQSGRIPEIDREIYYPTAPTMLDLAENRAIDQLYDEQVFRFGVENFFRTRAEDYGSRELVTFNIYQDIHSTSRPIDKDKTWSDNLMTLEITPVKALRLFAAHRADVYNFKTKALSTGITVTDGDLWTVTLSTTNVRNEDLAYYEVRTHVRQYNLEGTYKLNSCFSFYFELEYDDIDDLLTNQRYGIRQRLGNAWLLDYYCRYRQHAGDDDNFSFNVSASLIIF